MREQHITIAAFQHFHTWPSRRPEMSRRAKTPEERMDVYPLEFWDILANVSKGQSWAKSFPSHAQACSFIGRFYNFRYDVIEMKQPGALNLRDVYVTGRDASGELFHTRRRHAPPPIAVEFMYVGTGHKLESMVEVPGLDAPAESPHVATIAEAPPTVDAGEEAVKAWLRAGKPSEGGTAPGAGEVPSGQCQHEVNDLTDACFHCGKPREEW